LRRETSEIRHQRSVLRDRLIAERLALPPAVRAGAETAIARALIAHFGLANPGVVACYWPHRGEPSVHGVMLRVIDLGGQVGLPAPVRPREPMAFRSWGPRSEMVPGLGGIPRPAFGRPLRPDLVIIPMVGFDARGYRLGYGGGYYDRTLATLSPRPRTIGVAFEQARLRNLDPQPHDVPVDAIVTEEGFRVIAR
jgi:5-formyltetrahydrofolate cyclo-ligase